MTTETNQTVEHVLCVPTLLFHEIGHFQGFMPDVDRYLTSLLDPQYTSYRPRDEVEEDPSYKQLIPYCIFRHEGRVFHYARGAKGGESRLHAKRSVGIGGHISTFASSATLYEVGFNHFFRGRSNDRSGDQVFFQGHASPGIYARAFLEGRISQKQCENFRRELQAGGGLPSYPHPWLAPGFWEFPTVSMGLASIDAIYQARFNRYLHDRGLCDTQGSRVWAFMGDGETDEPEVLAQSRSQPARISTT